MWFDRRIVESEENNSTIEHESLEIEPNIVLNPEHMWFLRNVGTLYRIRN